jgi:peptidoglycan hydrolase-like protein with peptidoglycan-binding domain
MKPLIAGLFFASVASLRADQAVAKAQQVLKDEGFYYGEVSGEKNADTSAAIRRYQIRNGLGVTGELDDQTLQSLRKAPASTPSPAATTPAPVTRAATPGPAADGPDQPVENSGERDSTNTAPIQPLGTPPPQDREPPNVYPGRSVPLSSGGLFQGTPFESVPPEVQQRVIADAQKALARQNLFKYQVDGVFSPDMEFSLRAYQSRVGLRTTGRLDLETLAALELLPGAHERVYTPRRSFPPSVQPPVRGEWIRP